MVQKCSRPIVKYTSRKIVNYQSTFLSKTILGGGRCFRVSSSGLSSSPTFVSFMQPVTSSRFRFVSVVSAFSPVSVSSSTQRRRRLRNEGIEASDVTPTSEMEGQLVAMMASSDFSPIKEARPASSMLGLHDNLRETSCVSLFVFRTWLSPKYETSSNTRLVSMGSAANVDSLRRCTSSDQ